MSEILGWKLSSYITFYPPSLSLDPEQLLAMQDVMPDEEAMMNLAIALSLVCIYSDPPPPLIF